MIRPGIAVIAYGAQYAPQIGKFVRKLGVWSELVPPDTPLEYFDNAYGIIHSGSRYSASDKKNPFRPLYKHLTDILHLDKKEIGFCFGQQLMHYLLGGKVVKDREEAEYGVSKLHITNKSDLFKGLNDLENVLMSHRDIVVKPAPEHVGIGYTKNSPYAATKSSDGRLFGVQFHPEVYQTPKGRQIISNFLDICGCKRDWSPGDLVEEKINRIKQEAGDSYVVVLASGGKDSTTAALLTKRAVAPEKLCYLHVDTGVNRKGEAKNAKYILKEARITKNFHIVDASEMLFDELEGISNDREKRIIVGDLIYKVAENFAADMGLDPFSCKFVQGTLTTDKVESSAITGVEDEIKVHHNVTPLSKKYREQGRMIEPLDDFYKDDSKELGRRIGTPEIVIDDEPMPGPGFAIRTKCIAKDFIIPERDLTLLGRANILANKIAFEYDLKAYVRPYSTVGIQGDTRTEAHPVIIEGEIDKKTFNEVSKEIPDTIKQISRVWFLLEPKKIDSIELQEAKFITRDRIDRIREYENATKELIRSLSDVPEYTQFPLFLIPDSINESNEIVVLRPFYSLDYMTGDSVWLSQRITNEICDIIEEVNEEYGFDDIAIALEGEGKPPGTTELE